MLHQERDQFVTLARLHGSTVVVEGANHPLPRTPLPRFAQGLSHLLANGDQDRRENQGGLDRHLHRRGRPCPDRGHSHEPFGQGTGLLAPPPAPIQLADLACRQHLGIAHIRQIALPPTLPPDRPQAHRMPTGIRAGLADRDALVAIRPPLTQHLHRARRGLLPPAGDNVLLRVRQVLAPRTAEQPQVTHHQPAPRQHRQALCGKALLLSLGILGLELPQRLVTEGFHHHQQLPRPHQALTLPPDLRLLAQGFQRRAVC